MEDWDQHNSSQAVMISEFPWGCFFAKLLCPACGKGLWMRIGFFLEVMEPSLTGSKWYTVYISAFSCDKLTLNTLTHVGVEGIVFLCIRRQHNTQHNRSI